MSSARHNQSMFEDLPAKLLPLYKTESANMPILLYEGPCALHQNSSCFNGSGSVRLDWLPQLRLTMRFLPSNDQALGTALGRAELEIPRLGTRAEAFVTSVPMLLFANGTRPVEGRVGRIEFGEAARCTRVRFHLPNFLFFHGAPVRDAPNSSSLQRAVLEHGGFRVSMDRAMPFGDPLEDEIRKDGGYAITHVGIVERIDGSALSLKDSEPVLNCLGHYLSFCRGSWTCPVLLCAEDGGGSVVGQRWELGNTIDGYKQTRPWLPRNEPVGAHMSQAFRGFADAWFSALWREAIRIATQWYVESSTGAVEKSIILTQAAFELLAWTRLVEDTHALSKKMWEGKSMSFAEKLRQLLQSCSIPLSVPAELDHMLAYSEALRVSDGPEALTSLRNALVHPSPSKRKRLQEHPGAAVDAWKLGLWYLDLIILHVCGYKSRYSNKTVWGWPADDAMAVPWA